MSALIVLVPCLAFAQTVEVEHESGLLTIRCTNARLADVFERIEAVAGVELILEDAVRSRPLTASLDKVPVAMAVQRVLEGSGVNFAVMMDPYDWGRVDKIFLGAGGGGPSRPLPPPRPVPQQNLPPTQDDVPADDFAEEDFDDFDDMEEDEALDDEMLDPQPDMGTQPVAPGTPNYLPPQQAFPRSRFTPGLPTYQPPPDQQQQPAAAPFPYLDALGRPIQPPPQPPDPRQQQQQQQQQRQR